MDLRQLPWNNLRRHAGRTAGLVALVALLAFVVYGGSLVVSSLQNGIASLEARLGADVIVVPETAKSKNDLSEILIEGIPGQFYMDAAYVERIAEREGVEKASPQYYLSTVKAGCCDMPVQIVGFDPATDFTVQPWIARTFGGELGRGQVVVGCNIDGAVGATIQLYGVKCDIVSKLAETGTKLDNAVFATNDTVRGLIDAAVEKGFPPSKYADPAQMVSTIQVKVADGYSADDIVGDIKLHVRGVTAVATKAMTADVADGVAGISGIIGALLGVIWVFAVAVLVIAFTVLGKQRTREFAVLRTIGASRKALSGIVVKESAIVSAIGALAGIAAALVVVLAFNGALEGALGLPFLTPPVPTMLFVAAITFAITLVVGCAASALSANRLSKVDADQILREE